MATFARPQIVPTLAADQFAHILFRNPAQSGVHIVVRKIMVTCASSYDIGVRDGGKLYDSDPNNLVQGQNVGSPCGIHTNRMLNERPDGLWDVPRNPDGGEVLSKGETYGSPLAVRIAMGQIANISGNQTWDEPIYLQEDRAVMVRTDAPGIPMLVSWVWDEVPAVAAS